MAEKYQPGALVNQYQIIELLGTGANAEVYLARHTLLKVDRAIKVLREDTLPGDDGRSKLFDEYKERYTNEWQLAARIRHPHLIQVYDIFEVDGSLFAVVEFASKGTLKDVLDTGIRQSEDYVLEVLEDCALGLNRLHKLDTPNLVHCFVNPKTIAFDENRRAKITNFGRARTALERLHPDSSSNLEEYEDYYQAPEFSGGRVAATSDVYSLGCVAFELLTGSSFASTGARSCREIEPNVAPWMDQIVMRMLSSEPGSRRDKDDPKKRYVDMDHLLEILHEVQQPGYIGQLLDKLLRHFNQEELYAVCIEMGVDHEDVTIGNKRAFAREMVRYFQRRQRLDELIDRLRRERPAVDWAYSD